MLFMLLRQRVVWGLVMGAALVGLDLLHRGPNPAPPKAVMNGGPLPPASAKLTVLAQGHIPMPANTPSAHASNLLAMPAGHRCALMAFWFAGTRESAPDVQVAQSCYERSTQQWSVAQWVVNRADFGAVLGFGLRRLGNPVAWLDAQGRVHLFVVATGLGGWAASRIVHLRQSPPGTDAAILQFAQPRVLPLSWLWNTSFLVRGAPLALQDGGMVLPVYFELGLKYPVALRFDADGNLMGLARMSSRRQILQPALIAFNERHWLALMRDNRINGHVAVTQTGDGGETWRDLPDLSLSNPDASIAALTIGTWQFVLAHNSSPHSRRVLDLSESANGIDWNRSQTLAAASNDAVTASGQPAEFSYPSLAWADGSLWVSYTDGREHIAWQRFAWQSLETGAKP